MTVSRENVHNMFTKQLLHHAFAASPTWVVLEGASGARRLCGLPDSFASGLAVPATQSKLIAGYRMHPGLPTAAVLAILTVSCHSEKQKRELQH